MKRGCRLSSNQGDTRRYHGSDHLHEEIKRFLAFLIVVTATIPACVSQRGLVIQVASRNTPCDEHAGVRTMVRARHVLVEVPPKSDDAVWALAQQRAIDARNRLLLGGDFETVERVFSEGAIGRGQAGGDLGYFGRGIMVPEVESAAFCQPVGVIGPLVKSSFGFHIMQVLGLR